MTYDPSFAHNLDTFRDVAGNAANVANPTVIYGGDQPAFVGDTGFYNFRETARIVREFDEAEC